MFSNEQKKAVDENYYSIMDLYSGKKNELEAFLINLDENEKYLLKYIYSNLPISDIGATDVETIFSFVTHSIFVRENSPWGKDIPFKEFLINIAFPRVNNEKIEDHRRALYDLFAPFIEGITDIYEAAVAINYASLQFGTYRPSSRRTASPLTFLKRTFGRCGEEATFLASVFKSLGIPARQIYTPHWAHCDDNHAWVEVFCDGKWHFLGACEPEAELDRGWFNSAAARSMLLHVRAFDNLFDHENIINKEGPAIILNRTSHYAETKKITVEVLSENCRPVENAQVYFEIINYANFESLCIINTDKEGKVSLISGIGTMNIKVVKDGFFTQKIVDLKKTDYVKIDFSEAQNQDISYGESFEMTAPADSGKSLPLLSKERIKEHKERRQKASQIRDIREKSCVYSIEGVNISLNEEDKIKVTAMLEKAKFNGEEIIKFLNLAESKYAIALLETLDEKDYADCNAAVLLSHLEYAATYEGEYSDELFISYILAPRISFEEIKPYRECINMHLDDETKAFFKSSPEYCFECIDDEIQMNQEKNFPGVLSDPITTLLFKEGNPASKDILFIAIMRTLGICARNNSTTGQPEYYKNGRFVSPKKDLIQSSRLIIKCDLNINWVYGTNWSLTRLDAGIYKPCEIFLKPYELFGITLIPGDYRLLTVNRLPNGNSLNKKYCFTLNANKIKEIAIDLRPIDFSQMLINISLRDFWVKQKNEEILISEILEKGKNMVLWLGEGEEPTEHILNEMAENKELFINSKVNIIFLSENEKAFENGTLAGVIDEIANIKTCIDENFQAKEPVARNLYVDPSKLPLVMVCDENLNAIYGFSGYKVGLAGLIESIISADLKKRI